jgi:hypothetical protein
MGVTLLRIVIGFAPDLVRPLQQKYGALPVIWRAQMVALVITLPFGGGMCCARTGCRDRLCRCWRWGRWGPAWHMW